MSDIRPAINGWMAVMVVTASGLWVASWEPHTPLDRAVVPMAVALWLAFGAWLLLVLWALLFTGERGRPMSNLDPEDGHPPLVPQEVFDQVLKDSGFSPEAVAACARIVQERQDRGVSMIEAGRWAERGAVVAYLRRQADACRTSDAPLEVRSVQGDVLDQVAAEVERVAHHATEAPHD